MLSCSRVKKENTPFTLYVLGGFMSNMAWLLSFGSKLRRSYSFKLQTQNR